MQAPRQQPFLAALTDLDDLATERIVVDPNRLVRTSTQNQLGPRGKTGA
jgi:hypothetical protein